MGDLREQRPGIAAGSVAGEKGLESRQGPLIDPALKAAPAVRAATPHHQSSGGRVESYVSLVVVRLGEFKASLALLHDEPYVAGRSRTEPDREVLIRSGVVLAAAPSQDLAEDIDGVRGQIRLA